MWVVVGGELVLVRWRVSGALVRAGDVFAMEFDTAGPARRNGARLNSGPA